MIQKINDISPRPPVRGGAGQSARPSVNVLGYVRNTPVVAMRQASIRLGFHARQSGKKAIFPGFLASDGVDLSPESGFSLKAVSGSDSGFYLRRFDYRLLISSFAALLSPLRLCRPVLVTGPAFSEVTRS
jgi:hypothetical protein